MKTTFMFATLLATGLTVLGCSSGTASSAPTELSEADARSKASAFVANGNVTSATRLDEGEEHRWKVEVALASGAALVFEYERASGALAEIEGEKGPFDYDLPAPAEGFLTFGQAKAKALAAKASDVELWEVKTEKTQYEYYVREPSSSRLFEIKLDARTGVISSVEEKDRPD